MGKDEDEQPTRGFKVADRRRFVETADETSAEPASPPSSDTTAPPSAPPPPAEHEHHDHEHHDHEHHDHEHHDHGHAELNFSTFIMGLTTQALMHLGEIAEPGQPQAPDLAAAKQMIDLLGILRDKTTGNLDADEEQLLASMLYDLRMRYVEVSRHR